MLTALINRAQQPTREQQIESQLRNWQTLDGWRSLMGFSRERMGQADATAAGSRNQFMGAITNMAGFDPGTYAREQAGSMYNTMSRDFNAAEGQRRAAMNRRGMLNSTVGNTAAQTRFHDALANAMSGLAMQTAGMRQNQLGTVAGMYGDVYGRDMDQSNMFTDMMYGSTASRISQEEAKRQAAAERKNRLWGGLISAGGNILGAKFARP